MSTNHIKIILWSVSGFSAGLEHLLPRNWSSRIERFITRCLEGITTFNSITIMFFLPHIVILLFLSPLLLVFIVPISLVLILFNFTVKLLQYISKLFLSYKQKTETKWLIIISALSGIAAIIIQVYQTFIQ